MTAFICPLCQTAFTQQHKTQICENNHHFDIAKEGYLNLLPVQAKSSKNPGDNKEMMAARRAFLDSDGYRPLADKVAQLAAHYLQETTTAHVLDLGCGEGYYTNRVQQALPQHYIQGLDIAKVAIRYAAKRYTNIDFCVASAYQIPLADSSMDLLLRIYAPSKEEELYRVIKENGYLITVTPAPRHLYQLREVIYDQVEAHPQENDAIKGFTKIEQIKLNYPLKITEPTQLKNLINMTPFAWKFNQQTLHTLLNQKSWEIECDFNIEIFKKD